MHITNVSQNRKRKTLFSYFPTSSATPSATTTPTVTPTTPPPTATPTITPTATTTTATTTTTTTAASNATASHVPSIILSEIDLASLERDPGLRRPIWKYPPNVRDDIRREYIRLGAYQPQLRKDQYSPTEFGNQRRRFQAFWFNTFKWLEYSIAKDAAFCFPCYLFEKDASSQHAFTIDGFKSWKSFNFLFVLHLMHKIMAITDLLCRALQRSIPESALTHLAELEFLLLDNNLFTGSLPRNISKLKALHLGGNKFSGFIPSEIGVLHDLQVLELNTNSFEGIIPSSFGQLTRLETLDLAENHFNSSIPPELGLCTKLNTLVLYVNSLTGPLPLSFTNLTQITELHLYDNYLSGEISAHFISNWTGLISLQIDNNTFSGNIPSEIGMLENLTYLYLYSNDLTGPIPGEIGKLKELWNLDLSDNHLLGSIPDEIENLRMLIYLDLSENHLVGSIPASVWNFTNLVTLFQVQPSTAYPSIQCLLNCEVAKWLLLLHEIAALVWEKQLVIQDGKYSVYCTVVTQH
ncbi:hypothetical protein POM88_003369 [Heracleum sosnowskyi]|uniref:TTF-type domain-containing protein n=1 Tax=Heracleum sosnowskyi TaxID=360622 RepID=A0AAD8JGD5_9APIA|nr:hypothetical protein POM88_003369 [Heracleum sosnowskyi]